MSLEAWLSSCKRAWQDPWMRWVSVVLLSAIVVGSVWFFWHVVPARRHIGTVILHYNIYFGIDAVQSWGWVFLIPAIWFVCTVLDILLAFGYYRDDMYASYSLLAFAFLWSVPWVSALYYLARINV